ncbi:xanthine dehydrogenase family protein molybdopterin-binding subunit [Paroceanicella profunda]|uniref:Xanthine dehydrogenase family protein molybdopterin-binding subunit n=1 Tax=Paroceanicella profunda TaxID=2579971 RepID=A0A5B8FUK6_9RHOB|nr:xanthine dehydrogenase family protein molybdopterin-binding subunit [Paroceanicella profunda]QDL90750.1 xanthine dehydrogenase family protein molybdopterin-binding subunit [Paroceanicella profunda]
MNDLPDFAPVAKATLSRRGFLGATAGLALVAMLPVRPTRAETAAAVVPGTRVPAFLEIRPDGSVHLLSPFVEGGQGIATGMAQTIGEELDVNPARFEVDCAPPGPDYAVVGGIRMTGGSFSTRSSYPVMRQLGATAREMLMRAAATRLGVDQGTLTTEDGRVIHAASGRSLGYGDLAEAAFALEPAADVALRDPATFRWIGKPVPRLDMRAKSTGRAIYAIDQKIDGMLYAAVRHADYFGTKPLSIRNEAQVRAMPGVHSLHLVDGALAVCADSWWRARKAVESIEADWSQPEASGLGTVAKDFSSEAMLQALRDYDGETHPAETEGDAAAALKGADKVIEAEYVAPYLAHGQLEPPSAMARFNADGTLDLWLPNQAPEMFQGSAAAAAGLEPAQVRIHSPMLGGFFGRHFVYGPGNPYPQAIALAKATGTPVKVIWSREEEFLNDAVRPLSMSRFRAAIGADGLPAALEVRTIGEGPIGRYFGAMLRTPVDSSAVEGIVEKPYAIPNRAMVFGKLPHPVNIAFWRSVGHSMNDFFYESFLDEIADAGGQDPMALRRALLGHSARHLALLDAVEELSGGWKRGPFEVDGQTRARGLAMASPFGSETATIAEASVEDGAVKVHDVWVAFDPGSVVNPAIVKKQVESAVALGLSAALYEEVVYEAGRRRDQNYDTYTILTRDDMPRVHVTILESGAPMGGVGEPGLPGVLPAVGNAVATATGQRPRRLPMKNLSFS